MRPISGLGVAALLSSGLLTLAAEPEQKPAQTNAKQPEDEPLRETRQMRRARERREAKERRALL